MAVRRLPRPSHFGALFTTVLLIAGILISPPAVVKNPAIKLTGATTSASYNPNGTGTSSGTWTKTGTTNCASVTYTCINDYPDSSSTGWVSPSTTGASTANDQNLTFGSLASDIGQVTSVTVNAYAKATHASRVSLTFTASDGGEHYAISTQQTTAQYGTSASLKSVTLTPIGTFTGKTAWDTTHLGITEVCVSACSADTITIYSVDIVVHYISASGYLTQSGYIFENDDQTAAANANSDTAQSAGNTTITGVQKGERLNLRTQLKDATNTTSSNIGLFYDRNDNYWTKVKSSSAAITGSGSCNDTNFSCTAVAGHYATAPEMTSIAVAPNGTPWMSFYDSNTQVLVVASYVGSGGSGCGANGSTAWNCTIVASTDNDGQYNSIGVDPSGNVWVAYYDATTGDVMIAENVAGSGCDSSAWTCTAVDDGGMSASSDDSLSLVIDAYGVPWLFEDAGSSLEMVRYVGGSGGGDCLSSAWDGCAESPDSGGVFQPSGTITQNGNPWIFQNDGPSTNGIYGYQYIGLGGTGVCDCMNEFRIDGNTLGERPTTATGPDGNPWVAWHDTTDNALEVANYVGSGGNCPGDALFNCTLVDNTTSVGAYSTLAFDPVGHAWVVYKDATNNRLRLARYVGSGGTGCKSGVTAWTCSTIDSIASKNIGNWNSLAFAPDGTAYISTINTTDKDVRVLTLNHGGEIVTSPAAGTTANDAVIASSHSDMTSVSDNTDQSDADCIGGGTWANGAAFSSEEGSGISLPSGDCTEVAFTLDTSQAQNNTTYRFTAATKDASNYSRQFWRGPTTISQTPSLTTAASTTTRYSKDNEPDGSNCTDTAWTCSAVESTNDVGQYSSTAYDSTGAQWIAYYDNTNGDLRVANYVGSGGTGCASTAWTCTVVDSTNNVGQYSSIAIDQSGNPWISYYDATQLVLRVANYVGSNGTGCASTAWTCVLVDGVADNVGTYSSIGFDSSNIPWVSYYDITNGDLRVAHFVGGGGSGCIVATWNCIAVDSTNNIGEYTSIAFDNSSYPWISYYDVTNQTLRVAKYVVSSGSGCASSAWTCTAVDTTNDIGQYSSIAFDSQGNAWVSYYNNTSGDLRAARYVGSSGSNCASTAWTCTSVDTTNNIGKWSSIAFDHSDAPRITYYDATNLDLRMAKLHVPAAPPSYAGRSAVNGRSASAGDLRYRLDAGLSPRTSTCASAANRMGYCGVSIYDSGYDSMAGSANETPMYEFATRSTSNTSFPSYAWTGQSNVAASTSNVVIQVYRFGTTNAWTTLATNTSASANTDFTLVGTTSAGSASEYWQADSSNYWTYYRVYQVSGGSAETLKTQYFTTATPTFVTGQTANNTGGGSTTLAATFPASTKLGDLIVASVTMNTSNTSTFTCSDSQGNTYSNAIIKVDSGHSQAEGICYAVVTTAGASTVTATYGATSTATGIAIAEYTGTAVSSPKDVTASNVATGTTAANNVTTTSATTGLNNELLIGGFTQDQCGSTTVSAGTNDTIRSVTGVCIANDFSLEDRVLATAGSVSMTETYGTSRDYVAALATFLPYGSQIANSPPNAPTSLAQFKSDGTTSIATGGWTNQTQVILKGTVSDPDSNNTSLCVEVAATLTSPASPTPCGTAVTSGTTASVNPTGLVSGTTYKWQAKAEDSNSAYSNSYTQFNSGSAAFSVDTAAPTTGSVYDGSSAGVDANFNSGSLSSLSCNWSGFADSLSGLASYDYSFGTTAGATNILGWTNVTTSTTNITANSLTLNTSQIYYCNVRANDVAGNTSTVISSNGQSVAPSLTFSVSSNSVTLSLNVADSYTDTKMFTVTTSTNAYNGYIVRAYESSPISSGSHTIADYTSPASAPTSWSGTGFGYNISGGASVAAFSGSKYAHFGTSGSSDIPVNHGTPVSGTAISNETETVTLKASISPNQAEGVYSTHLVWTCLPSY